MKLHRLSLIKLPANGNGRKLRNKPITLPGKNPLELSVDKLQNIELCKVTDSEQSALYNELIQKYHYLGYTPMAGAQIRYLFSCKKGLLGAVGFGASAWKVASRDDFIGWAPSVREKKIPTMGEFINTVASFGGYLGRKCDGPPGAQAIWLGMRRVIDFALAWNKFQEHHLLSEP